MLSHPELDDRLSRNTQSMSLLIQGMNHPDRKIHIHAFVLLPMLLHRRQLQIPRDIFSTVEFFIKVFSFHKSQPPRVWIVARRSYYIDTDSDQKLLSHIVADAGGSVHGPVESTHTI